MWYTIDQVWTRGHSKMFKTSVELPVIFAKQQETQCLLNNTGKCWCEEVKRWLHTQVLVKFHIKLNAVDEMFLIINQLLLNVITLYNVVTKPLMSPYEILIVDKKSIETLLLQDMFPQTTVLVMRVWFIHNVQFGSVMQYYSLCTFS